MPNKLSKYRAASSTMGDISESLSAAAGYGYEAYGAGQKGLRQQQGIADTLDSLKKVAGAVQEYRQESQFRKQTGDIARGAYGVETVEEKGFLGIPKTTYQDVDTGEKLSMMDIYATKKYGEGSEKYKRWFGEEAQGVRGMKQIAAQQQKDITSAAESYKGRISEAKEIEQVEAQLRRIEPVKETEQILDQWTTEKRETGWASHLLPKGSKKEELYQRAVEGGFEGNMKDWESYLKYGEGEIIEEASPINRAEDYGLGYDYQESEIMDMIPGYKSPGSRPSLEETGVKRKPGGKKQIGPGRQPLIDPQDQVGVPDSVIESLKLMDEDIAPLDFNYGNKDVAIATLLGEAGVEGREGMEAVLGTLWGRQDALMQRGEGDFSLEQIALAPSQYSFWNETDVRSPDAMLDMINKMKGDNPRGWELAADVLGQSRGVGSSPIHSYLNPQLAEADELKRFQSLPGQEFSIGSHIFKSAPDSVLSPDYLWDRYGGGQI